MGGKSIYVCCKINPWSVYLIAAVSGRRHSHFEQRAVLREGDLFGMKPKHEEIPSTQLSGQTPKQSITGTVRKWDGLSRALWGGIKPCEVHYNLQYYKRTGRKTKMLYSWNNADLDHTESFQWEAWETILGQWNIRVSIIKKIEKV